MDRRTAKELLHLREWLARASTVVAAGQAAYLDDVLLQEAGDSFLMKIGETANRLARTGLTTPPDVRWADAVAARNWLIHQYDAIDRAITWSTLTIDLPRWRIALEALFAEASSLMKDPGATSP